MKRFTPGKATNLILILTLFILLMTASIPVYAEDDPVSNPTVIEGMEPNPEPPCMPPTNFTVGKNSSLLQASSLRSMSVMSSTPTEIQHILRPTQSASDIINVDIPPVPPTADVVFAFDLTGSMTAILNTAKANAVNIMTQLDSLGSNVNFGVISFMDYPYAYSNYNGYSNTYGKPPEYAYRLDQSVTNNKDEVAASINSLTLGNGWDFPEAYTRMMYESYADSNVAWRPGAKRIVICFGDSVPHDNNINEGVLSTTLSTGGDPGRDGLAVTADDLDLQTVLADMAANGITLIECHSAKTTNYNNNWNYWTGLTGGAMYITSSATLVDNVITAVKNSLKKPYIEGLHLVPSDYASWVTTDPVAYPSVPTGTTQPFNVTFTVPDGTAAGEYKFILSALDKNNVNYGDTNVTINVQDDDIPPMADICYDIYSITNSSVVASLVNPSEPITITNNGGSAQFTFTNNGTFTFEFADAAGNIGSATANVTWIDKVAPTAQIKYSTIDPTCGSVTASLIPSEPITVTNNGGSTEYTFKDDSSFTFEFVDAAGNTGSCTASVDWIYSGKGIIKVDMGLYNGCRKNAEVHLDAGKLCGRKFYNEGNLNYDELSCKGVELRSAHLLDYGIDFTKRKALLIYRIDNHPKINGVKASEARIVLAWTDSRKPVSINMIVYDAGGNQIANISGQLKNGVFKVMPIK